VNVVVNLHGRRGDPQYDPDLNAGVIYLGRNQFWGPGRLLRAHPLANNYPVKKYGLDLALRLYRIGLLARPDLDEQLALLRGKTLACWCHPAPCHCHLVAELLAERWGES
jgi:hypothetical protein